LKKEDWSRWQQVDPELPPYKVWLTKIEATIALLKHRGQTVSKITVDPDAFSAWCRQNGHAVSRTARGAYAADIMIAEGNRRPLGR
jgi:hypothetical protein